MSSHEIDGIGSVHPRRTTGEERRQAGREVRKLVPRRSLGDWTPPANRRDPIDVLEEQNADRVPELIPIRYGRMAHSPFTFLRGAPAVMANDLASSAPTPLRTQLCGDAHLLNFGSFGTAERNFVFDMNDFDETLPGPFEWDVKRLVTSVVIAARATGKGEKIGRAAARAAARAYRLQVLRLADAGVLEIWYERFDAEATFDAAFGDQTKRPAIDKMLSKARHRTSAQAFDKLTERVNGRLQFRRQPPLLQPLEPGIEDELRAGLLRAVQTLPPEYHQLADRYRVECTARKVVGVGSVGTRCMVAAAVGRDEDDVLMLQIKEAQPSVLAPYAGDTHLPSNGARVVVGQRLVQAASDPFLCWAEDETMGRSYYVRQLRDMKGSVDIDEMLPTSLLPYAEVCGRVMATAHARAVPPTPIAGYLGTSEVFDDAMEQWAVAYADQTEVDHAQLLAAIDDGSVPARLDL
ncbi:MAG: DUF2252 domain-containing protein [Actinomycetes bacterium]